MHLGKNICLSMFKWHMLIVRGRFFLFISIISIVLYSIRSKTALRYPHNKSSAD